MTDQVKADDVRDAIDDVLDQAGQAPPSPAPVLQSAVDLAAASHLLAQAALGYVNASAAFQAAAIGASEDEPEPGPDDSEHEHEWQASPAMGHPARRYCACGAMDEGD